MPNQQWQVRNDIYYTCGDTVAQLPPGFYDIGVNMGGPYFTRNVVKTDALYSIPDPIYERIMQGIQRFWSRASVYAQHGLVYKRGILLYGPPGSGKTAMAMKLVEQLCDAHGGVTLSVTHSAMATLAIKVIREQEPKRPIMLLYEDIDNLLSEEGAEEALLRLLDGEDQTNNIIHVATTNYINKLPARFTNRPSRFDECVLIDMPSEATRKFYLEQNATADIQGVPLAQVAADTAGFSFAHLRELIVGTTILEQPYAETLGRLKDLFNAWPKPKEHNQ